MPRLGARIRVICPWPLPHLGRPRAGCAGLFQYRRHRHHRGRPGAHSAPLAGGPRPPDPATLRSLPPTGSGGASGACTPTSTSFSACLRPALCPASLRPSSLSSSSNSSSSSCSSPAAWTSWRTRARRRRRATRCGDPLRGKRAAGLLLTPSIPSARPPSTWTASGTRPASSYSSSSSPLSWPVWAGERQEG